MKRIPITGEEKLNELSVRQYLAVQIFLSRLPAEEKDNGGLFGLDLELQASDAYMLADEALKGFR